MTRPFWTKEDYLVKLQNLLRMGRLVLPDDMVSEEISDFETETALALLEYVSENKPPVLMKEVHSNLFTYPHMLSVCLAMLAARGPEDYLSKPNIKEQMLVALSVMDPTQLLEFIEYLKSKTWGRGFGSRPQKMVRKIMESWDADTIEKYIYNFESEMKALVRLVHPKYTGYKGDLVKILFDKL